MSNETEWKETAHRQAKECLPPDILLYDFQIVFQNSETRIRVFLDKLSDSYGSPNVEDCESFSKVYGLRLQELIAANKIPPRYSLEVSSAGAERRLHFPADMVRFSGRPLKVHYIDDNEKRATKILLFCEDRGETSYWQSFLTRCEKREKRGGQGRKKNRETEELIEIKNEKIQTIHLYLDV